MMVGFRSHGFEGSLVGREGPDRLVDVLMVPRRATNRSRGERAKGGPRLAPGRFAMRSCSRRF